MPAKKMRSIKKPAMYEDLRQKGMSKQEAARISNAQAKKTNKKGKKKGR